MVGGKEARGSLAGGPNDAMVGGAEAAGSQAGGVDVGVSLSSGEEAGAPWPAEQRPRTPWPATRTAPRMAECAVDDYRGNLVFSHSTSRRLCIKLTVVSQEERK